MRNVRDENSIQAASLFPVKWGDSLSLTLYHSPKEVTIPSCIIPRIFHVLFCLYPQFWLHFSEMGYTMAMTSRNCGQPSRSFKLEKENSEE